MILDYSRLWSLILIFDEDIPQCKKKIYTLSTRLWLTAQIGLRIQIHSSAPKRWRPSHLLPKPPSRGSAQKRKIFPKLLRSEVERGPRNLQACRTSVNICSQISWYICICMCVYIYIRIGTGTGTGIGICICICICICVHIYTGINYCINIYQLWLIVWDIEM